MFSRACLLRVPLILSILTVDVQGKRICGSALLRQYNTFPRARTCEPFEEAHNVCSLTGQYTSTRMPNFLNHGSQSEAYRQLTNFEPLIATQCSSDLLFLLCLYHFPLCVSGMVNLVVPCKGLCESVRDSCSPVLERHHYTWPELLNCDALPTMSFACPGAEPEICVSSDARLQLPNTSASALAYYNQREEIVSEEHAQTVTSARGGVLHPKKCRWKTRECAGRCCRLSSNGSLSEDLAWAVIGKVEEVSIGSNCEKAWYYVNLTHVLDGTFSVGETVRMTVRIRLGCPCPLLQLEETYFLARRANAKSCKGYCQRADKRSNHDQTLCSMRHNDVAQHLPEPGPTAESRGQLLEYLDRQGIPRWLKRALNVHKEDV